MQLSKLFCKNCGFTNYILWQGQIQGGCRGCDTALIFLCRSGNFVPFSENHILVVNSNKVTPSLIYLLINSVAGGGGGEARRWG